MDFPNTFDKIVNYIVYNCREDKFPIANSLIAYILNIYYDENKNDFLFKDEEILEKSKSEKIIKEVLELIHREKDGVLETLKLQILYVLSQIEEEEKVKLIKAFFEKEIGVILNEIKSYEPNSRKEYDTISIYKKIFNFLLVRTRQATLDSLNSFNSDEDKFQNNMNIEKEIYSAFDNVLPKSALPPFIALSPEHKISNLNELSNIVMGIRLLNKELGKGGIGLYSLNEMRNKLSKNLFNEVRAMHVKYYDICLKYIEAYESIDSSIILGDDEEKSVERIKNYIIFYHQLCTYLSLMMDELNSSQVLIDNISFNYNKEVQFLIDLVEKKSALSKTQVYPQFEMLSKLYAKFQEQFFIMNIRENVIAKLNSFLHSTRIPNSFDKKELGNFENIVIQPFYQGQEFSIESGLYQNGVTIIHPHNVADFMDIKIDYQGFCIVSLLDNNKNKLVNGKPNVVAKYKDKYLVFYSNYQVQDFLEDPDKYLTDLKLYLKKNSHLINLLNAVEEFPEANLNDMFRNSDSQSFKYKSSSIKLDAEQQTSLHPELEEIDPKLLKDGKFKFDRDYIWNEWELKKKALQKADIMKKTSIACQTNLSHFRRENETQIYEKKSTGVNTNISKGTNLSVRRNYVSDLRDYENKYN